MAGKASDEQRDASGLPSVIVLKPSSRQAYFRPPVVCRLNRSNIDALNEPPLAWSSFPKGSDPTVLGTSLPLGRR